MLRKKLLTIYQKVFGSSLVRKSSFVLVPCLILLALPFLIILFYSLFHWGQIFPGISIAGIDVGRLKPEVATKILANSVNTPEKIVIAHQSEVYEISVSAIGVDYNYSDTARSAYYTYRTGNILYDFYHRLRSPFEKPKFGLRFSLNETALSEHLSVIAGQIDVDAINPSVNIINEKVVVNIGVTGKEVDTNKLRLLIGKNLSVVSTSQISAPVTIIDPTITDDQAEMLKLRAENILEKKLVLKHNEQLFEYSSNELFKLLDVQDDFNSLQLETLIDEVASALDREPRNSVFVFEGNKVKEFTPALDGINVDKEKLGHLALKALDFLESSDEVETTIEIPVKITPPEINTEDVNSLGIKELLGRGESRFKGSISSRIHNIGVASEKFNGVLIKPGKTFSFNNTLGDVSAYTGYKQAYIIKDGKTMLGDGGGVCQVSTTFFRAALDTGLPIAERRAHSYRVAYYEQGFPPGLDATVYAPTTDLKVVNDTPGYLLVQTKFYPKNATLIFEIYGTDDGRVTTTTKPIVTDVTPPPEDLYIDDPTKPIGYTEQIDWPAWGAKVNFDYTVEREGKIIYEKTFYSNFRPWQAKFLRGTAPPN